MNPIERLVHDAALLGVTLRGADTARLLKLLDELERWNRTYNLTAVEGREALITHHLLDSLAVSPDLNGTRVADVGTGAGFPGLPLAVVNGAKRFTLIDSNGKKTRFVEHVVRTLELQNVIVVHARAETLRPETPFDTITARAVAPLDQLLERVKPLCGPASRVIAMKGRWPEKELSKLPPSWRLGDSRRITVPGLEAERCVLVFSLG